MTYIKTTTNDYPLSLDDIKIEFPEVIFPLEPTDEQLVPYEYANVVPAEKPDYNEQLETVQEVTPTDTGLEWVQTWETVPLSSEEINGRIATAKSNRIDDVWAEYDDIDRVIHMTGNDMVKNKRKHDISNQWSSYGTAESPLTESELAAVDTLNLMQVYVSKLNGEIDTNSVAINALETEQEVLDYEIVFSPIPAGLPNTATISAKETEAGSEYSITTLGDTDWPAIGAPVDAKIGDIFTATGTGTGTGSVTATISVTELVDSEEYTIATAGDTDWTEVGAIDSNAGTVFIAVGTTTGTGTATPSSAVGAGFPESRLASFFRSGNFPK